MDLVLIEWVDSHGTIEGWKPIDKEIKPELLVCESVGWLLYNGKDCKKIIPHKAGYKNENIIHQGRGDLTIPTKAIIKIKKLKY
jgi:hypothetical protein